MAGRSELLPQSPPFSDWPESLKATLRLLLPSAAQIVMFVGPDYRAFYNDAYAQALGNKHPRALGAPAKSTWPEVWEEIEPLLDRVLRGETVSGEDRVFALDRSGEIENLWFDISYSPIRDADGTMRGVFCVVSETTERVRSERALRESERRFRAAVDGASIGIATLDADLRILVANRHFSALFRGKGAEVSGLSLAELLGSDNATSLAELLSVDGKGTQTREISIRHGEGQSAWVSISMSLINTDSSALDATARYCLVARDVTEQRRETARALQMAAIISGSEDAILAVDLNTRITSWNNGAAKLYGYAERSSRPTDQLLALARA